MPWHGVFFYVFMPKSLAVFYGMLLAYGLTTLLTFGNPILLLNY